MKNDSAGGTIKHSHVGKVCKGKQGQFDGPVLADDSQRKPLSLQNAWSVRASGLTEWFLNSN
jgi:hypothetical protein